VSKKSDGARGAKSKRAPRPKSSRKSVQPPGEGQGQQELPAASSDPRRKLEACLPPPCLLPSESRKTFKDVRDGFLDALGPTDALEMFFIANVVDLAWEVQRYRRMRADLLSAVRHTGLDYLVPEGSEEEGDLGRDTWVADIRFAKQGLEPASDRLKRRLAHAGITMQQVEAATLLQGLPDVERICRLEDIAQARLHACLEDLERRRDRLAARARSALAVALPEAARDGT
jgi:hypothetical protein